MARFLFVLPSVDPETDVRLDTAPDTVSPALVSPMGGGDAITGAKLNAGSDGALPRVVTFDGTATLFLKVLDYSGTQIGDPVEVTGVNEDTQAESGLPDTRIHAHGPWDATDPANVTIDGSAGSGFTILANEDQGGWAVLINEPGLYVAQGVADTETLAYVRFGAYQGGAVDPRTGSTQASVNVCRVITAPALVWVNLSDFTPGYDMRLDVYRLA